MVDDLRIRATLFRLERALGVVDELACSVERSAAAVSRSRARLAATDPRRIKRLFAARMDRSNGTTSTPFDWHDQDQVILDYGDHQPVVSEINPCKSR